jgi:cobalt/nickel transport system permease protein
LRAETTIPQERSVSVQARPASRSGGVGRFLERSVASLSETIERDLLVEELASRDGYLQRLDPRVKIAGALALVIAAGLVRHLPVLVAVYVVAAGIGVLAGLPAGTLVRRVWLALPFFTAVVAVPAIFSFVTPGAPLVSLGPLTITAPGLRTALTLVFRVASSVTVVLLLVLSTRWPVLLRALRSLHVPMVITLILSMTYRYIFLLARVANSMFLARRSRTIGRIDDRQNRGFLGATAGLLVGKSYHLSNEVYLAMLSRGYRGEPTTLETFRLRRGDVLALIGVLVLAGLLVLVDRAYAGPW